MQAPGGNETELAKLVEGSFHGIEGMCLAGKNAILIQEMAAYLGQIAVARRAHGADDLITALVAAEVEGEKLEEWEILGFCMLLLVAGNETTTNLIGNILN